MVSNKEMISIILNALTDEQGNLVSNGEEEAIPFNNLRTLCKIKENRVKGQNDEEPRKRSQTNTEGRRKFGIFGPQKKKKKMAKAQCIDVKNMCTIKEIVLKGTITKEIKKKPILPNKWKNLKQRSLK